MGTSGAIAHSRKTSTSLIDRVLLATWILLYAVLLLAFSLLRRTERHPKKKVP